MDSQKSNRLHVTDPGEKADVAVGLALQRGGAETDANAPLDTCDDLNDVDKTLNALAVDGPPGDRATADRSAVAPKRARGRLRVEAILAASAAVFAEQGYDAATMTEIAQRSGTAIGSLYRFFPSKAALADMLVDQYASHVMTLLADVARTCEIGAERGDAATRLADALVDMMTTLLAERASVLALVDAQGAASAPLRARLRGAMLEGLVLLLRQSTGASAIRAMASAKVVLLLLKGVPTFSATECDADSREPLLDDLRALIAHQLMRT